MGLPVSITNCTASALNCGLNRRRCSAMDRSSQSRGPVQDPWYTPGQRVAIFYTKVHHRLLRPLIAADAPPAPPPLQAALRTIDRHVHAYIDHARLADTA